MSHLESLISRYLDGELSPAEIQELRQRLDQSPEARTLLHEMTAVTRSARGIPSLDTPSASLEARLFRRLQAEGLGSGARPVTAAAATSRPAASRLPSRPVIALLLLLFSLSTSYWLSEKVDPAGTGIANGTIPGSVDTSPGSVLPENAASAIPSPATSDIAQPPAASSTAIPYADNAVAAPRATGRVRSESLADRNRSQSSSSAIIVPEFITEQSPLPLTPVQQENNTALTDNSTRLPEAVPPPYIPPPDRSHEQPATGEESIFAASFRPTTIGLNENSTPDLSLRLDAQVGRGHQVSFIVSRSSLRSENRATALLSMSPAMASSDEGGARSNYKRPQETTSIELDNETWGGVGYSYTLARLGPMQAAVGVRAGAGSKSMRLGLESAFRVSLSDVISFEAVPTLIHVIPHDRSTSMQMVQDESTGTLSFNESKRSNFTTAGLEVGVRIALR